MKTAAIFIVAAVCFAAVSQLGAAPSAEIDNKEAWQKFKQQFNKTYDSIQDVARFARFVISLGRIAAHNALANSSFKMALNAFADFNDEERAKIFGAKLDKSSCDKWRKEADKEAPGAPSVSLPASIDWRQQNGRVSAVKYQGTCGSCWAFATVAMLEGQDTDTQTMSEQQLVDCSPNNNGCGGGWMATAIDDLRSQNAGMESDSTYPYINDQDSCHFDQSRQVIGVPARPMMLPQGDEQTLRNWVANWGPVSVGVMASDAFMNYGGGIFTDPAGCESDDINHAVTIVGYGTDQQSGLDYWIIKNSWNTWWGEDGFMRIQRGVNLCNIENYAVVIKNN